MAPVARNLTARPSTQGLANGGSRAQDPPPSTLAANLVSNLSNAKGPRNDEEEDFQRLLLELSENKDTGMDGDSERDEDQVEHNHKLIYALAKAVLAPLLKDTSFGNVELQLQQASEAIDILITTINDTPPVLAHIAGPHAKLQTGSQVPLWLWLFPQVLPLLGASSCENIQEKIQELITLCFSVSSKSRELWGLHTTFFQYFKHCSESVLDAIQNINIPMSGRRAPFSLSLPLDSIDQDIVLRGDPDLHLGGCTYTLHGAAQALKHTAALISSVVKIVSSTAEDMNATIAFRGYISWVSDTLLFIDNVQQRSLVCVYDFGLLEALITASCDLVGFSHFNMISALKRKVERTLITLAVSYFTRLKEIDIATEECVARVLDAVADLYEKSLAAESIIEKYLIPVLLSCQEHISIAESLRMKIEEFLKIFVNRSNQGIRASQPVTLNGIVADSKAFILDGQIDRPLKRRKIENQRPMTTDIIRELYILLGSQPASDLIGLNQVAGPCFTELDDKRRCRALKLLQRLACAAAGTLQYTNSGSRDSNGTTCGVCDTWSTVSIDSGGLEDHIPSDAVKILENILATTAFQESGKPRVQAMMTLRSFIEHFRLDYLIDLEKSAAGQWCLKSLQSSLRELRIAAGRTLPLFLFGTADSQIATNNRSNALDILRQISKNSAPQLTETCILAWGQVGRAANDHELNLVLLRLVEYLGDSNQFVSSLAFNEILLLAEARKTRVALLFSPFWRSIAPVVVKDLQSRPQSAQLMADALSMSVADLLITTQAHTLPWLVLTKRRDAIIKIAEARGDEDPKNPWRLCFENTNMAPIMACLLVQNVPDLEAFCMTLMKNVSPHFKDLDLLDLLRIEPIGIALELLKSAGEVDSSKKSRIRFALQFLAARLITTKVKGHGSKKANPVGPFLEQYILGIMSHFSELLNDLRGYQSVADKQRSLKGLEELVIVGKSYVRSALPQICACLQTALNHDDLRSTAFSAWVSMVRSLDEVDVEMVLENTFAVIILHWNNFDARAQALAHDCIGFLLTSRRDLVLGSIEVLPSLSKISGLADCEKELRALRKDLDIRQQYQNFQKRITHEHASVVSQALVELVEFVKAHQGYLQTSAVSDQPDPIIGQMVRSILDACVKFNGSHPDIVRRCAECFGLIGCLDSNRIEAVRPRREIVVVSNFADAGDTTDFVLFLLEVLVKVFLSATNPKAQGLLSYAMQELLDKCDFKAVVALHRHSGDHSSTEAIYQKWLALPEAVQATLTPFLNSFYVLTEFLTSEIQYPIYQPGKTYRVWLRSFVLDLLEQPHNQNAMLVFTPLCRVARIQDTSVASFLLPFVVLHAVVSGDEEQWENIRNEIHRVLSHEVAAESHQELTDVKLCSEAIFRVLDYMSRWSQDRQAQISRQKGHESRWAQVDDQIPPEVGVEKVNKLLSSIPPETISSRAVECNSYARALFHWEQHIRQSRDIAKAAGSAGETDKLSAATKEDSSQLQRLQEIYAQIDEPDGIEGISAHLNLDIDQQILAHQKNGRWAAAQSWYEIKLSEDPADVETQINLLQCLKESGQHDVLLNYIEGMNKVGEVHAKLLSFAAEASWTTGRWDVLHRYVDLAPSGGGDFNVNIGRALDAIHSRKEDQFFEIVQKLRDQLAGDLSMSATSSLGSCHDNMLHFHVLTELEIIAVARPEHRQTVVESLDRRLEAVGSYSNDKQYLLGIRRAAMELKPESFQKSDIASAWLMSAKLARKGDSVHQSFNAVLHASKLGDASAKIEHARLLWKGGNSRQAIQSLQSAIKNNAFISHDVAPEDSVTLTRDSGTSQQNMLKARAHLLLAKWQDSAGQTHAAALRHQYQTAVKEHQTWEKGHYYLGRHYNKLLEAEKALSPEQQTPSYITGETARLVIENYLRSLNYGTKYIYQTLPRLLTLWLDLGSQVDKAVDGKAGNKDFAKMMFEKRKEQLKQLHGKIAKYMAKMPAYIFYTALPQIVARIAHPNPDVYKLIQYMIIKVVDAHPQQALWTLFAVSTSNQPDRKTRGAGILQALRSAQRKSESGSVELRSMIQKGEKLASELLMVCNAGDFQGNRTFPVRLTADLGFTPRNCLPSPLVVPVEATLTATLPTLTDKIKSHKAFSGDVVTVSSFQEEVTILSSLQKPRKLTARGSDGRLYGLMCKPKDDLRKDQRLMEFNSMINRSLKRNAESSKRQLYIKTYAVTPLNEECGIIEWVDGLKTLRDILLSLYKARGISPNYGELKMYLDEACNPGKLVFFTHKVLDKFPPVFHTWFISQFPDPSAWFNARLKYTRSCAVMSMVGTILGLGDRHGENILFQEGNGGTFHVDFNCLFDKGLTFAQPERVPFRLTHNMVDAMGVYGVEGPFRKSCELTLSLLRQHEDTLMTILEAFVYDPTLDFLAKKNKRKITGGERGEGVPDTAQGVLDAVRRKVRGLLVGESVPLGVEGQVDELIKLAVDPKNLAAMYIGWCAFF